MYWLSKVQISVLIQVSIIHFKWCVLCSMVTRWYVHWWWRINYPLVAKSHDLRFNCCTQNGHSCHKLGNSFVKEMVKNISSFYQQDGHMTCKSATITKCVLEHIKCVIDLCWVNQRAAHKNLIDDDSKHPPFSVLCRKLWQYRVSMHKWTMHQHSLEVWWDKRLHRWLRWAELSWVLEPVRQNQVHIKTPVLPVIL